MKSAIIYSLYVQNEGENMSMMGEVEDIKVFRQLLDLDLTCKVLSSQNFSLSNRKKSWKNWKPMSFLGPIRELKSQDKLPPWYLKGQANWESPRKTQDLNRFCVKGFVLLFSHSVLSDSLPPCGLQHARLPCPSLSPRVCLNSCPLSWWCHSTISSATLFSCPESFPGSGSFPMSWLFTSGGQSIGVSASASVLPEYSGLISFRKKMETDIPCMSTLIKERKKRKGCSYTRKQIRLQNKGNYHGWR